MAKDVYELIRHLGYESVFVANYPAGRSEGSGHFIPEEKPRETVEQIIGFLG